MNTEIPFSLMKRSVVLTEEQQLIQKRPVVLTKEQKIVGKRVPARIPLEQPVPEGSVHQSGTTPSNIQGDCNNGEQKKIIPHSTSSVQKRRNQRVEGPKTNSYSCSRKQKERQRAREHRLTRQLEHKKRIEEKGEQEERKKKWLKGEQGGKKNRKRTMKGQLRNSDLKKSKLSQEILKQQEQILVDSSAPEKARLHELQQENSHERLSQSQYEQLDENSRINVQCAHRPTNPPTFFPPQKKNQREEHEDQQEQGQTIQGQKKAPKPSEVSPIFLEFINSTIRSSAQISHTNTVPKQNVPQSPPESPTPMMLLTSLAEEVRLRVDSCAYFRDKKDSTSDKQIPNSNNLQQESGITEDPKAQNLQAILHSQSASKPLEHPPQIIEPPIGSPPLLCYFKTKENREIAFERQKTPQLNIKKALSVKSPETRLNSDLQGAKQEPQLNYNDEKSHVFVSPSDNFIWQEKSLDIPKGQNLQGIPPDLEKISLGCISTEELPNEAPRCHHIVLDRPWHKLSGCKSLCKANQVQYKSMCTCMICMKSLPYCLSGNLVSWYDVIRTALFAMYFYYQEIFFHLSDIYHFIGEHKKLCTGVTMHNLWKKTVNDSLIRGSQRFSLFAKPKKSHFTNFVLGPGWWALAGSPDSFLNPWDRHVDNKWRGRVAHKRKPRYQGVKKGPDLNRQVQENSKNTESETDDDPLFDNENSRHSDVTDDEPW